jgi:hypothetical protein
LDLGSVLRVGETILSRPAGVATLCCSPPALLDTETLAVTRVCSACPLTAEREQRPSREREREAADRSSVVWVRRLTVAAVDAGCNTAADRRGAIIDSDDDAPVHSPPSSGWRRLKRTRDEDGGAAEGGRGKAPVVVVVDLRDLSDSTPAEARDLYGAGEVRCVPSLCPRCMLPRCGCTVCVRQALEREWAHTEGGKALAFKPNPMRPADAIPLEYHTVRCYTVLWPSLQEFIAL